MDEWDDLIGGIYDAAFDPALWPTVIERATEALGARQAKMAVLNLPALEELRPFLYRLDPVLQERWFSEFVDRDLWTRALYHLPPDGVDAASAVVPHTELRRSDVYSEFLRPDGIEDCLVALLGDGPAGRSHVIFFRDALFDHRQLRLLRTLAPHLRRAVRTQEQLVELSWRAEASETVHRSGLHSHEHGEPLLVGYDSVE